MLNKIISVALVVMMSSFANAADSIDVNPDMGKPGQPARVPKDNEFKVCADQDNLPKHTLLRCVEDAPPGISCCWVLC